MEEEGGLSPMHRSSEPQPTRSDPGRIDEIEGRRDLGPLRALVGGQIQAPQNVGSAARIDLRRVEQGSVALDGSRLLRRG